MSEAKFTRGPWIYSQTNWKGEHDPAAYYIHGDEYEDEDEDGDITRCATGVCKVAIATNGEKVAEANAALIASAPDFAKACEMMMMHEDRGGDGWWLGYSMLKSAYQKANP